MKNFTRRSFITKSLTVGIVSSIAPALTKSSFTYSTPYMVKDDISIAQWALVDEIRGRKWGTLDFPKVAREDFDINGIELVSTLFEVPTFRYLKELKRNADDQGVKIVLIMVGAEGNTCTSSKEERTQTVINHQKWIDIAHYLGCHSIRTDCRGTDGVLKSDALKWAADTYNMMLEYAIPANIGILIENHGGLSNDPDWMVDLMKEVNNLYFGSLPDWRQPGRDFDNYTYLEKMLPYAKGMSYRNQPTKELTVKMIDLCRESGYRGWYGIESKGREEIKKGIEILKKHLLR